MAGRIREVGAVMDEAGNGGRTNVLGFDDDLWRRLDAYDRGHRMGLPGSRSIFLGSLRAEQAARDAERRARDEAAPGRDVRRRVETREAIERDGAAHMDVRHLHSVLAVCGMPYSTVPIQVREFGRRQGQMAIDLTAGSLRGPDGQKVAQPLPSGPKARLLMMHLCSEAVRQRSATIRIADSLTGFLRDMGFPATGGANGTINAFKQQINALAACTIRLSVWDGRQARSRVVVPFESVDVWFSDARDGGSMWPREVTFSDTMYASLQKHALPVNRQVVKALSGSARLLDAYFWLTYRAANAEDPVRIGWKALTEQFGEEFSRPRAFRDRFREDVARIVEVLPALRATLDEAGLTIVPAKPEDLALPPRVARPAPAKRRD